MKALALYLCFLLAALSGFSQEKITLNDVLVMSQLMDTEDQSSVNVFNTFLLERGFNDPKKDEYDNYTWNAGNRVVTVDLSEDICKIQFLTFRYEDYKEIIQPLKDIEYEEIDNSHKTEKVSGFGNARMYEYKNHIIYHTVMVSDDHTAYMFMVTKY